MSALVSFERVFEVLDLQPMVQNKKDALMLKAITPSVEFRSVSFAYPKAEEITLASLEMVAKPELVESGVVLKGIDFLAKPGTLTGIVGPSGAGKSTISALIPRLYDVTEGAILIDGIDIRDLSIESLREHIGVVTQDSHMFHDSILVNLRYANEFATIEEIESACKSAQIWDLISSLPNGLETIVGERGHRLSGGEKQRLAIARLLLKKPSIVIMDEATAHLDSENESLVQSALKIALAGRTSLVIAHRLSTIAHADQILVLENGLIAERGTHDELIAKGGLFYELYQKQNINSELI
jgi:ATP-binding cassette subfamily B protein